MAIPFSDDFDRADGALVDSINWFNNDGSVWSIDTNQARWSSGSGVPHVYCDATVITTADYTYSIDAGIVIASATQTWGIGVRMAPYSTTDVDGYFALHLNGEIALYKRVSGTWTEITPGGSGGRYSHTPTVDVLDAYELDINGTTLTLTLNSTQVLQTTDSSITASGSAGHVMTTPQNSRFRFDNAVVDDNISGGTAALSGTITSSTIETNIVNGGKTIVTTLTGDTFDATLGADNAITTAYIAGIDSAQAEAAGWDAEVLTTLTFANVVRTSSTVCTITLPAVSGYSITSAETITQTVPASALVTGSSPIVASPTFSVTPDGTGALSGTITSSTVEADIVGGGKTIITTLTNDTFDATLGADNAVTTAYIAGLDSAQAEAAGWDAEVLTTLTFANVVRTSDTVCTITLPAVSGYSITASETITQTIPASALVLAVNPIVVSPTFAVTPDGTAALSGTILSATDESDIVSGGKTIITTLSDDTFDATLGADNAVTTAYIAGLDSAQAEAAGWDAEVLTTLTFANVVRTSDTVCTITLPAVAGYDITSTETITQTIPATALVTSADPIVTSPTFNVAPVVAIALDYGDKTGLGRIIQKKTFVAQTPSSPPTVEAGGPYSGDVDTAIALNATVTPGSDASPTILWEIVSGGTGTFSSATIEDPTFTPDDVGPYVLRLTVSSVDYTDVIDTANLTSNAVAPTVEAGGPYSGLMFTAIALNATVTPGSDASPIILWEIVSGGTGSFSNDAIEDPTFTPDNSGAYVLRLTVTPGDSSPVVDTADLTSNVVVPPTVDAGGPYAGDPLVATLLAATVVAGTDPTPTLLWEAVSGGTGVFNNSAIEDPTFTPDAESRIRLRLTATPSIGPPVIDEVYFTTTGYVAPVSSNGMIHDVVQDVVQDAVAEVHNIVGIINHEG